MGATMLSLLLCIGLYLQVTTGLTLQQSSYLLPDARNYGAGVTVNDSLAIFAYGIDNGSYNDVMDVYRVNEGWSSVAQSSPGVLRKYLAAASTNGIAIFAGGLSDQASDAVDIFNSTNGEWSSAKLAGPSYFLAATTFDGTMFFAGGLNATDSLTTVNVFDTSTGLWNTTDLSVPRAALVGITIDSWVIFAGGQQQSKTLDTVDVYDSSAGIWHSSHLSRPTTFACAASASALAYVIGGGSDDGSPIYSADLYNPESNTTSSFPLNESIGGEGCMAISVGDVVVIAGGGYNGNVAFSDISVYDNRTQSWTNSSLTIGRSNGAMVALGDMILIVGGENSSGDSVSLAEMVILTETSTTTTTTTPTPPLPPPPLSAMPSNVIIISQPTSIPFSIIINSSVQIQNSSFIQISISNFSTDTTTITVEGCVNISGSININTNSLPQTPLSVALVNSTENCLSGAFQSATVTYRGQCIFDRTNEQISSSSTLSIIFPSQQQCSNLSNMHKQILIASVTGGVLLLMVVVAVTCWIFKTKLPRTLTRANDAEPQQNYNQASKEVF